MRPDFSLWKNPVKQGKNPLPHRKNPVKYTGLFPRYSAAKRHSSLLLRTYLRRNTHVPPPGIRLHGAAGTRAVAQCPPGVAQLFTRRRRRRREGRGIPSAEPRVIAPDFPLEIAAGFFPLEKSSKTREKSATSQNKSGELYRFFHLVFSCETAF